MSKTDTIGGDNLGAATRKMTTQDKLTLIVQARIHGEWRKEDEVELGTIYQCIWDKWRVCIIEEFEERIYSLPDLIADPGFMKAVYGEECRLEKAKPLAEAGESCAIDTLCDLKIAGKECSHKNYINIALNTLKLLLTSTPDAAIEYLYKEINDE